MIRSSVTLFGRSWQSIILARAVSQTVIASPEHEIWGWRGGVYIGVPAQPQALRPLRAAAQVRTAEPADRLTRRQSGNQLACADPKLGVTPIRGNVAERHKHEAALVQTRVRQHEGRGRALAAVIIEQVEIEAAGGVASAALASEAGLEGEKPGEQCFRQQGGGDRDDAVDDPRQ